MTIESKSADKSNFIAFLNKFGFHFPKEHGFTVILLYSVLIGLSLSFKHNIDWVSSIITLFFVLGILFSNTAIMELVKTKFKSIHIIPPLLVTILGVITFLIDLSWYNLVIFSTLTGFFFLWLMMNIFNRGHTTEEFIVGTLTLTFFIPVFFLNTTIELISDLEFIWLIAIWWLSSCFTIQMSLYVQIVRKKQTLGKFTLSWILYLISLIPFYFLNILSPITGIVLIEPSFFILKLRLENNIPIKPKFKKIGRLLTLKLMIFFMLLTLSVYL